MTARLVVRTTGQCALEEHLKHSPRVCLADLDAIIWSVLNWIEYLFRYGNQSLATHGVHD